MAVMGGMSDSYKRCGESKNGEIIMGGGSCEKFLESIYIVGRGVITPL